MGGTRTPWGQDDRGHVGIVGTGTWGAHGWTSWDRDTRTLWGQNRVRPIEGHHGDRDMGDGDMWGTRTPWGQDCVDTWMSWGQGHTWTPWGQDHGGHTDILGTKLWDTQTPWGQGHVGHVGNLGTKLWDTRTDMLGWGHVGHEDGRPGDRDTRTSWGQNHVRPIEGHRGDKAVGPTDILGTGAHGTHGWTSWGQGHMGHTDTLGTKLWDTRTDMLGWGHVGHMMDVLGTGTHRHLGDKAKRDP